MSRSALVVALLCLLLGAAVGGVAVAAAGHLAGAVRVDETLSGEVTVVNGPGDAVCLNEDHGGVQLCSDVLQRLGDPILVVGERVTVTRIIVNGTDALLVLSRGPTPT